MVQFPPDVQEMLDRGELWRAKQRVGGRISSWNRYDPTLYEQYGVILMRMGDHVLAGKYLFLSGERSPEYAAAIALFVKQHGRGGWRTMLGTFPGAIRKLPPEQFPEPLRDDFADMQFPPRPPQSEEFTPPSVLKQRLGCVVAAFLFTASAIGVSELIQTLWHGFLSLFK